MLSHQTTCVFQVGVATPLTGDCATPDSSMDSHPQLETTLRFVVQSHHGRSIDIGQQDDRGAHIRIARARRACDGGLFMTLNEPRPPLVGEADLRRVVASIASVCGLTDGREQWHCEGEHVAISFAVHRKGGIKLLDDSTSESVAHMSLRGRRLTNRNKKQPPSPEEPYVFEAKTPKNESRQDEWVRREGGAVEAVAHPFIAILRELYRQALSGSVSLQDCIVPWKGGVGGQPNGNLECYEGKQLRRVHLPVLCFAIDEGI
jgi:hypothetical protein